MVTGVFHIVLLFGVSYLSAQSVYPGVGYYSSGFGPYPGSFGHGHFQKTKAYPPVPKKTFTIADELKYGPKFNPNPFLNRKFGYSGFPFPDEGFFTTQSGSTQSPSASASASAQLTVQASVSATVSGGAAVGASTTTTAPPGATTEDEDKVVAGAPAQDCPSGQMRAGGECRDVA